VANEIVPARTNLIALRDRREAVIAALSDHFAHDVLDVDEFDRRVTLAHQAHALADLDALLADLAPVATGALVPTANAAALATWPQHRAMRAILGGFDKRGAWTVATKLRVTCFWGGGKLDFREAQLAPGVTELHVTAIMGGLEIIVPPWLSVECDATAIMGGFEERERTHQGEQDRGRALLRITGFVVMGGVSIETRLPGESRWQARRRMKKAKAVANRTLGTG